MVVPKKCFSCTVSGQVISLLSFYPIVMLFVIFSSFLVFFCHSLPICLLFIVTLSFLVLFWFAGFGSAAPPKTYFLATVESGFATFPSFDVIYSSCVCNLFVMFVPFFVVSCHCYFWDWLVFELSETKLNDKNHMTNDKDPTRKK